MPSRRGRHPSLVSGICIAFLERLINLALRDPGFSVASAQKASTGGAIYPPSGCRNRFSSFPKSPTTMIDRLSAVMGHHPFVTSARNDEGGPGPSSARWGIAASAATEPSSGPTMANPRPDFRHAHPLFRNASEKEAPVTKVPGSRLSHSIAKGAAERGLASLRSAKERRRRSQAFSSSNSSTAGKHRSRRSAPLRRVSKPRSAAYF